MAGAARRTTDHEFIRRWVDERGGCPARVKGTGGDDDPGILRIDYPGYSGEQSLEEVSWEEFFEKFEESELAFLYQEEKDGNESRFSKLVRRSGEEEAPDDSARSASEEEVTSDEESEERRSAKSTSTGEEEAEERSQAGAGGTKVSDVMTKNPVGIAVDASLHEAAKLFADLDTGALPVVEDEGDDIPIGVLTDRDIVTRAFAHDDEVGHLTVRDVMTSPALTIGQDDDVEDAVHIFEQAQVRRAVVVDDEGRCCGMLAQADLAFAVDDALAAELVRAVSMPNEDASRLPE